MSSIKSDGDNFVPLAAIGHADASRRRFLELMGASLAMAGAAGCTRQPPQFILPYVVAPERAIPGIPSNYATANVVRGLAEGIVVESHLGRPTKVEGNPLHPASLGATGVHSQACVLDLYDPDRAKEITEHGVTREWSALQLSLQKSLDAARQKQGAGLYILTQAETSPTLGAQMAALRAAFPAAKWRRHDPVGSALTPSSNTYYKLDRAAVIVSLDSDFLACGPASTRYAHDFAAARRLSGSSNSMNRLYSIESELTATGGKADHRLPLRYAEIEAFARALAAAVASGGAAPEGPYAAWVSAIAKDLLDHRGASAIIVGESQSPAVAALARSINATLGNGGTTVIDTAPIELGPDDQSTLRDLTDDMAAGKVETLLILGGNPVYTAPPEFEFAKNLAKVPNSIHLTLHRNETSNYSRWVVPQRHFLEDWGDARAFDGTVTILQPLILPLYVGRSNIEVLDALLTAPSRRSYDIVRDYWSGHAAAGNFEDWWRESVRSGVVKDSVLPPRAAAATPPVAASSAPPEGGIDVLFRPDPYLLDGAYANNAWLMELPRPVNQITWDNAVYLSPRTAARLGVKNDRLVELTYRGRTIRGPVYVSRGQADDTAVVHLGFGRTQAGKVGNLAGFDAYPLRPWDTPWAVQGAGIRVLSGSHALASTQMHHSMEHREVAISASVATYLQDPDVVKKQIHVPEPHDSLYPQWDYPHHAWGMVIDMTACVDCMACVVACQAENNIPVVGREEVLVSREMHWLRVDTYYHGPEDRPSLRYQPVPCMHCENAPCELVCPVEATSHSAEGLNEMTYNRCVGTRYCSNNCPYKVRRFNYLLYGDRTSDQLKLQRNPDVTVRSVGVMEKCTYCVQRIREAQIRAEVEDRPLRDGDIRTACQQVCPTKAIVFGDINDPASRVSQMRAAKLNYPLLAELNARPRTTYLAELRNPNPALEGVA